MVRVLVGAALCLLEGAAFAAGFEHPDNGTVALGRGGAFTARASDGSAFHYNPAALAGQRGTNFMLLSNFTDMHLCFTRDGTFTEGTSAGTAYSEAGPMCDYHGIFEGLGPMVTFSTDLGNRKLPVFGIGFWGPSSLLETGYSQNGDDVDNLALVTFQQNDQTRVTWAPSRFDLVDNRLEVIYIAPTVAYQITPELRVGAQFQWIYSKFEFTNYGVVSVADPLGQSARNHLTVSDIFTPGFQIGAQYQLGKYVQLGALFRYVSSFDADGDLEITASRINRDDPDPANYFEEDVGFDTVDAELHVNQASSLRLAARFALPRGPGPLEPLTDSQGRVRSWDPLVDEVFDVELDYVLETNGQIGEFLIVSNDAIELRNEAGDVIIAGDPVGELRLPHRYQTTHSLRLGGDVNVLPGLLAGRIGGAYETAASPVNYTLLDFPSFDRFSVHVGATVRLGPVDLSLAYAHIFQSDRDVTNGGGRIAGPGGLCNPADLGEAAAAECVTNNGHYETSYDIISIGAQGRF